MAEEENIVGELHGHFDQALRTALSGGLQITEQRARRRQHEAEAERLLAKEAARHLEERKRAELEANALLVQGRIAIGEAERVEESRRAVTKESEQSPGEHAAPSTPTAFPSTIGETLARTRASGSERGTGPANEHTTKPRHQRDRGAAKTTAEFGR